MRRAHALAPATAAAVIVWALGGCGGASSGHPDRPDVPLSVEVSISAAPEKDLLRVDVDGYARGSHLPHAFPRAAEWKVAVLVGEAPLRELVLSPGRVETLADTDVPEQRVVFAKYFQPPPAAAHLSILVTPPGADERRLDLDWSGAPPEGLDAD